MVWYVLWSVDHMVMGTLLHQVVFQKRPSKWKPICSLFLFNYDSDGKESACNAKRPGFDPWFKKIPWKGMATHSSILAWETLWTE